MQFDHIQIIDFLIGSLILTGATYIIGNIITYQRIKKPNVVIIIYSLIHTVLNIANYFVFSNILRILSSFLLVAFYYRIIFKKRIDISIILSFICMLMNIISEVIILVTIAISSLFIKHININVILNTSFLNFVVSAISISLIIIQKRNISKIINIKKNNTRRPIIFAILLILLSFGIIFFEIPKNNWEFDRDFYIDVMIILIFIVISFILLTLENKNMNLQEKYRIATAYQKINAKKIEEYSIIQHQYKNHLIIIKGYAEDNIKINKYIDAVLNTHDYKKYKWVKDINILPFEGLKYLIYQKLAEAESNGINTTVIVSEALKKMKSFLDIKGKTQLATIIGEYFDNAIYASNESKQKKLHLDIYMEETEIIVEIANTYKKKIDINKVCLKGYTTKGKEHGLGLYEVDRIIKQSKVFKTERKLEDIYFITKLIIETKIVV